MLVLLACSPFTNFAAEDVEDSAAPALRWEATRSLAPEPNDDAWGAATGFGRVMAAAGDADGDGEPEVLIGAHRTSDALAEQGAVYRYGASELSRLERLEAAEPGTRQHFGAQVEGPGDIDGDGYDDALVQASDEVHVLYGSLSGYDRSRDAILISQEPDGDAYGLRLVALGDQDSDGFADFAIPDHLYGTAGAVDWYWGGAALSRQSIQPEGIPDGVEFGRTALSGDFDGDGVLELLVGSALVGTLWYGADHAGGLEERSAEREESSVLLASLDLDHDGFEDLLEQSSSSQETFIDPGSASGPTLTGAVLTLPSETPLTAAAAFPDGSAVILTASSAPVTDSPVQVGRAWMQMVDAPESPIELFVPADQPTTALGVAVLVIEENILLADPAVELGEGRVWLLRMDDIPEQELEESSLY